MAHARSAATLRRMETQNTDQQQFDTQVNATGKFVIAGVAGVAIVAALVMSMVALMRGPNTSTTIIRGPAATPAAQTLPTTASAMIEHVTRGCHALAVEGAAKTSAHATVRLAAGGVLHMQNNDVMPQQLIRVSGPQAQFTGAAMNHMGASSSVTFPSAGTYVLSTKAGEDYSPGIKTIGPDNTLRLKVVVG
jgi:hypothetical protein